MAIEQSNGDAPDLGIDQEQGDFHVIDEAQYSHKRRLQAIHNAHDRVIEVRNAVEDRLITGSISEYHARRYYRGAVESFIMEVLPVLKSEQIPLSEDYAEGVEIGTVDVTPPDDLVQLARENVGRMPPGGSVPTPVSYKVVGLAEVLELPSPIRHRFSVAVQTGRDGVQVYARDVAQEIPRDLLDAAVQLTAEALEDAEMGLNIGSKRPRNSAGTDGKWAWESDKVLPHEIHDALANGDLTREKLDALLDESEDDDAGE